MKTIDEEFKRFIDYPTESENFVTSVSAKLFAEHMINIERNKIKNALIQEALECEGDYKRAAREAVLGVAEKLDVKISRDDFIKQT